MNIVIRILGILLIVMSVLLLIAVPPAGVVGIVFGVLCIVRSNKKNQDKINSGLGKSIEKSKQREKMLGQKRMEAEQKAEKAKQKLAETKVLYNTAKNIPEEPDQPREEPSDSHTLIGPVVNSKREIPDKPEGVKRIQAQENKTLKDLADETRRRMEAEGLKLYVWSTCGDERVRPSHAFLNDKLCKWSDPAVYSINGGKTWIPRPKGAALSHPGEEEGCRCTALSFGEELFGES